MPALLVLVAVTAVWGVTFVQVKDAVALYPLFAFLALRFLIASATLAVPAAGRLRSLGRAGWAAGALAGGLLGAGYALQTAGLERTSVSSAGFVTGMYVVLTPLLALACFRIRVPRAGWGGVAVATAGLALLSGVHAGGAGGDLLVLGPWTHGDRSDRLFGDVDFGPDAPLDSWAGDWRAYRLRFFDHVVKGMPLDEPNVRVFVMGGGSGRRGAAGHLQHGGRWITASDWPLPGTDFVPFHLHGDGRLDRAAPGESAAPLSYDFDPAKPVPTIGGATSSLDPVVYAGSWDQVEGPEFFGCTPPYLPLASRADVLAFQTEPLREAVQVIGPIEAELWVATDGPDTDFTAKLIDMHPPSADYPRGYAMILTDGIMRLRYAEDPAHPRLRQPGEVVRVRITLFPTANLFLPGHRIRLDISSSNFPKFDVNPNTGEPEGAARRKRVAVNTVFVDAARPSRVVLPIMEV